MRRKIIAVEQRAGVAQLIPARAKRRKGEGRRGWGWRVKIYDIRINAEKYMDAERHALLMGFASAGRQSPAEMELAFAS